MRRICLFDLLKAIADGISVCYVESKALTEATIYRHAERERNSEE